MNDPMKPSELKSFLKFQGSYNYSLKRFVDVGHLKSALLLQDDFLKEEVLGKIVADYNEGEFVQWPHLRHENVIRLLDMVPLNLQKTLFIFSFLEKSLRTVIRNASFKFHPKCFDRKRSYCRDVLSGLEYLHQKSVILMNLNDENVWICSQSDRAVISDLSSAKTISETSWMVVGENVSVCSQSEKAVSDLTWAKASSKTSCPDVGENVSVCSQSERPAISDLSSAKPSSKDVGELECTSFDIWKCGVMFLRMFTMHVLPWYPTDLLRGLTTELLRQTNPGSNLPNGVANDLKNFLAPFLQKDPNLRVRAEAALVADFLQNSGKRIDEEAREFWKSCETEKKMFGEGRIHCGIGDPYWKGEKSNHLPSKKFSHFIDVKLKKSKSNIELYTAAREANSGVSSFYKVTSEDLPNETFPLLKKTCSEDFGEFFSWVYDQTPEYDGSRVGEKTELETKMATIYKEDCSTNMLKSIEQISDSEDALKFYAKRKRSQISNSTFDLPCHCVLCMGQHSPTNIPSWPLPDICDVGNAPSVERKNTTLFSQTQGGFLHNNWKSERGCVTDKSCSDSVEDNSTLQSDLKTSLSAGGSDQLEFQKVDPVHLTWSRWIENDRKQLEMPTRRSEIPTRKVYPDTSFASGKNQLMFQRFTGFRGLKFRMPPAPMIIARSPAIRDEEMATGEKNEVKLDRRITREVDENFQKKGKKSITKKHSNLNPSTTESTENKAVDISMELPLFSASAVSGKCNKMAFKDKPKQNWIRGLCPGSFIEE